MNKKQISDTQIRIVIYTSLAILFFVAIFFNQIINHVNISKAESCFKSQNYICAFKSYKAAFSTGINNEKYIEHYVQTLLKIKKIAVVQEELNNLLIKYPKNSYEKTIEDTFVLLKKDIDAKYPDTYISNVVQGTDIIHWNNSEKPITFFIKTDVNVPDYYKDEIKNSFADYQKISSNKIKFNYTQNENEANILIKFVENISNGKCDNGENCSKILGLTENTTSGGTLKKSTVSLRTKDLDNTDFTANQIHNIAKHEIGHALGITGHSFYSDDVMYPVNNDKTFQNNTFFVSRKDFSTRDIQTINLLYNIIPDITNKKYDAINFPEMYMPIAVLGTKKQIGEKKLEEATSYINTVSNNFVSQMNLAESYFGNKDYASAINAFVSALQMAKTDDEKFTVYHNLAVVYYQQNDIDNAIKYSEMANVYGDYKKGNTSDEILAYCYFERKRYKDTQYLLEKVIEINPTSAVVSATLATSYLKQFNISGTIKEMKRIKEANPNALKDPCYGGLSFFILFI